MGEEESEQIERVGEGCGFGWILLRAEASIATHERVGGRDRFEESSVGARARADAVEVSTVLFPNFRVFGFFADFQNWTGNRF